MAPAYLKTLYEVEFKKKKDHFLAWAAPFLTADQKLQIETMLYEFFFLRSQIIF